MADDTLSAALEEIEGNVLKAEEAGMGRDLDRVIHTHGLMTGTSRRLLIAMKAMAKAHEPVQIYDSADGCPHPRPDEDERGGDALAEWCDDHPGGHGIVPDADVAAICLLSPREIACRACSELVYQQWGDDDRWISAGDCIVRPLITAHLLGEEAGGAEG